MPHFNGSKQAKKIKQVDTNLKPIVQLQFNIPKTVADDKRVKPAEVFEGFKDSKVNKTKNKSNK